MAQDTHLTQTGAEVQSALNKIIDLTVATTEADGLMSSSDKEKLSGIAAGAEPNVNADWSAESGDAQILNKPSIPNESTVAGWGFTKNDGTITGITMNGASKGTSGNVNLGTVITSHQDISDVLVLGTVVENNVTI